MQIKKNYRDIRPELLFDEVQDLIVKQGATADQSKMETYSLPSDSSSFISRGTLVFKIKDKECIRGHILGSARGKTKLLLYVDTSLFLKNKVTSFQNDLEFNLGSYEEA